MLMPASQQSISYSLTPLSVVHWPLSCKQTEEGKKGRGTARRRTVIPPAASHQSAGTWLALDLVGGFYLLNQWTWLTDSTGHSWDRRFSGWPFFVVREGTLLATRSVGSERLAPRFCHRGNFWVLVVLLLLLLRGFQLPFFWDHHPPTRDSGSSFVL